MPKNTMFRTTAFDDNDNEAPKPHRGTGRRRSPAGSAATCYLNGDLPLFVGFQPYVVGVDVFEDASDYPGSQELSSGRY